MGLIDDIYSTILGVYRAIAPARQQVSPVTPTSSGEPATVPRPPEGMTPEQEIVRMGMLGIQEMQPINVDMSSDLRRDTVVPGRMMKIQKALESQGRMSYASGDRLTRTPKGTLAVVSLREKRVKEVVMDEGRLAGEEMPAPPIEPSEAAVGGAPRAGGESEYSDYYAGFDTSGYAKAHIELRANSYKGRESKWRELANAFMDMNFSIRPNIANETGTSTLKFGQAFVYKGTSDSVKEFRPEKGWKSGDMSFQYYLENHEFFKR